MNRRLLFFVFSLGLSSVSLASDQVIDLLKNMANTMRNASYQGVYHYQNSQSNDTIRLIHKMENGDELERIVSLNGEAREVLRSKDSVTCILPKNNAMIVDKARAQYAGIQNLQFDPEKLKNNYLIRETGLDRVAGLMARIVELKPKDQYRYLHRFWIGSETPYLLKSEIIAPDQQQLESIVFIEISSLMRPAPASAMATSSTVQWNKHSNYMVNRDSDTAGWQFKDLPPGFELKHYFTKFIEHTRQSIDQWLFSDGLVSYSIFKKPANESLVIPEEQIHSVGSVNVLSKTDGAFVLTVMGEVPPPTIIKASKSIQLK